MNAQEAAGVIVNLRATGTPIIWLETEEIHRGLQIVRDALTDHNLKRTSRDENKIPFDILEWDSDTGMTKTSWQWNKNSGRPKGKPVPIFPAPKTGIQDSDDKTIQLSHKTNSRINFLKGLHLYSPPVSTIMLANAGEFLEDIAQNPAAREEANTWLYKMTETLSCNDPRLFSTIDDSENLQNLKIPKTAATLSRKSTSIIIIGPKPSANTLTAPVKNNIVWLRLGRPSKQEQTAAILEFLRIPGHKERKLKTLESLKEQFKDPKPGQNPTESPDPAETQKLEQAADILSNNLMGLASQNCGHQNPGNRRQTRKTSHVA